MTFGLSINKTNGALSFSSDDVTWNQVDMVFVNGGGSFSKSYPMISGRETLSVQMLIDPPPIDRKAVAHNVTVSGTTLSVYGGSEKAYIILLMR